MEKHQMKQLYQDIDVPKAELKNVIHSAAVRAGKEGAVRRRWGRKVINGLAVAAALFILYLSSGLFMPSVNTAMGNIPVAGQIYRVFQDKAGSALFKSNLVTKLNEKAESRGITVTVKSVYYDSGQLVYNFTVDNLKSDEEDIPFEVDYKDSRNILSLDYDSQGMKKMKDGRYAGQVRLFTDGAKMKDGDKLPLVITKIKDIPGNWRFTLPIKKQKSVSLEGTKAVNVNGLYRFFDIRAENGTTGSALLYSVDFQNAAENDAISIDEATDDAGNHYEMTLAAIELGNRKNLPGGGKRIRGQTQFSKPIDPKAKTLFITGDIKTESEPGEIVPLKTKLPVSYETKHHHVGITIKKIKQQGRRVIVDYQFSGIDVSKTDEDQLMNIGESIGLGNTKKMKTWPSLNEYEKGYYLKGNKAKVTNLKTGEMESVFELDDSSDKEYSLRDFSFDSYALYVNRTFMNTLAGDGKITFSVPVRPADGK
ncbi:DUF4179 domain-containing protein [Bacillus velezensis]|uniref:DUF4179 domain-containing protein n=1 Tax=Bacillus velezensis (strain DSM 23117 / BGSC 10A6 / LMG 26770 / FZB42) TaxID=326423 RepID=A7Z237_BACVZ|nr:MULTISPECIES: DUF4179 domain-containing protein [Bacillus amyloliquefaciens group]ABS73063.1 DUF4179 domain-containing protein [Bacillus velezensis FZB42]AGZ55360.1 hypothetical protein U471_06500 [Bacillus amyloliquefaciens CC178]MBG9699936.1 hypothetical protein [Bacillus amyloliquefaciens]MBT9268983.1 DUF4179 domain-containing protein [Bacillus velezensis]MCF7601569.1 DUF4179 domain-containing protein [Bacillus velezensis]